MGAKGKMTEGVTFDVSDFLTSLMYMGKQADASETREDNWNNNVETRLTGQGSEWALNANEYDPEVITANLEGLKKQHGTYQLNHPKKYIAGKSSAFNAVEEAIRDQTLQYNRALEFHAEYKQLLKSNDANIVKKALPLFDEDGVPIYNKVINPDGTIDFDLDNNGNRVQSTRMMSNWDVLMDDVINTSRRDEYGTMIFSDKSTNLIKSMQAGNEGIADRLFEFKRKFGNWTGLANMDTSLANMDFLLKESNKNILSMDDSLGGGLVFDRKHMEDFALALETDTINDFLEEKKEDRTARFNAGQSLLRERNQSRAQYLEFKNKLHPDGLPEFGLSGLTAAADQGDGIKRWNDPIVVDGKYIANPQTLKQLQDKYLPQLGDMISKIAPLENTLQTKFNIFDDVLLLGNDQRYINPMVLRETVQSGKGFVDSTIPDIVIEEEKPPKEVAQKVLNKKIKFTDLSGHDKQKIFKLLKNIAIYKGASFSSKDSIQERFNQLNAELQSSLLGDSVDDYFVGRTFDESGLSTAKIPR